MNAAEGRPPVVDAWAGLVHLKGLKQLHYLNLRDTKATDAGVQQVTKPLPNVKATEDMTSRDTMG